MKKCNMCLIDKDTSEFPKYGRKCKMCKSKISKEYRKNNKNKIRESSKLYYKNNKEKILNYSKEYYKNNYDKYKEYREENKDAIDNYHKEYVANNKEKISNYNKEYSIEYRNENKEKISNYSKEYRKTDSYKKYQKEYQKRKKAINYHKEYRENNKSKVKLSRDNWRRSNKSYHNSYVKNRMESDLIFNIGCKTRSLIKNSLMRAFTIKSKKTSEILGCSFDEFKLYIESKFEPWMNWNNYGLYNGELNYGWDIDHIVPLSSAKTEEDIIKLNHYTNLQPLCSYINRYVKGDKMDTK